MGRERSYDWFSADDVGNAQAVLADRMFASTWAKWVDLNPIDVCQLVGSGMVKAAADPITTATFPAKLQIDRQSRVEFEVDVLARVQFSPAKIGFLFPGRSRSSEVPTSHGGR